MRQKKKNRNYKRTWMTKGGRKLICIAQPGKTFSGRFSPTVFCNQMIKTFFITLPSMGTSNANFPPSLTLFSSFRHFYDATENASNSKWNEKRILIDKLDLKFFLFLFVKSRLFAKSRRCKLHNYTTLIRLQELFSVLLPHLLVCHRRKLKVGLWRRWRETCWPSTAQSRE